MTGYEELRLKKWDKNEEDVSVASKIVEAENIREVRTERTREVGTERSDEVQRKVKGEDIFVTNSSGPGAVDSKTGPEVEVSKPATKKHRFIRNTSFNDIEDEYDLGTGSVLTEKLYLVLADPLYKTSVRGISRALLTKCSPIGI